MSLMKEYRTDVSNEILQFKLAESWSIYNCLGKYGDVAHWNFFKPPPAAKQKKDAWFDFLGYSYCIIIYTNQLL